MNMYVYKVIRVYPDGTQGKRAKRYVNFEQDLKIGELYTRLGDGYPGTHQVLSMEVKRVPG